MQGKKTAFSGIGPDSLLKFHSRALLLSTPGATAYLKERVDFPINKKEVLFDIEVDPMRGVVYLHGFVKREYARSDMAIFLPHFAVGIEPIHEEAAFRSAWEYLNARVQDSTIYYIRED